MKLKHNHPLDSAVDNRPDLVILSGESGSGKSSLISLMRMPEEKVYTASYAMIDEVKMRGWPVNHDTIFSVADELYVQDPLWQVPRILAKLSLEGCLVYDGPRRVQEVLALQQQDINTTIVRVVADEQTRFSRLVERDGTNEEEFRRIVRDEGESAKLTQILDLANITIHNDGDLRQLQISARAIRGLLKLGNINES